MKKTKTKPVKKVTKGMHYTSMIALVISNVAVLSLAMLVMADFSKGLSYFEEIRQVNLMRPNVAAAFPMRGLVQPVASENLVISNKNINVFLHATDSGLRSLDAIDIAKDGAVSMCN